MSNKPHDKPDFTNKCYRTKDDKLHAKIFWRGDLSEETAEEREKRLASIRESRGIWVYDSVQKKVVRKEECTKTDDVDVAQVSRWDPEWALVATGRRMSKGELKRYCREHGKVWEN